MGNSPSAGPFTITLTENGGSPMQGTDYKYDSVNGVLTILSSTAMTISTSGTPTSQKVSVDRSLSTANLTLSDLNINRYVPALSIANSKTYLTLIGTNIMETGHPNYATLSVSENTELIITDTSTGTLTATNHYGGAGIGSDPFNTCGKISINGGTITAFGSAGAGIGGGSNGSGGEVLITGGTVSATSESGAGIGGGYNGFGKCSGGTLKISGNNTKVTAYAISSNERKAYDVGNALYSGSRVDNSNGGSLSVTDGATLIMMNNGTNANITDGIGKCTIEDSSTSGLNASYADNITGIYSTLTVTDGTPSYSTNSYWKAGIVKNDIEVTVTANTSAIQKFEKWETTGILLNDNLQDPINFIMPEQDVSLTAKFIKTSPPPVHIHSYGSEWKYNADRHWHECTAMDGAKSEYELHTFTPWSIDEATSGYKAGSSSRECKVCNYKQTEINTYQTLTDTDTGIKIIGYFTSDAAFSIKESPLHEEGSCPVCDEIRTRRDAGELIAVYEIFLSSGIYNGEVEISFPVDEKYNGQPLILLHCMDRQEERLEKEAVDGFVIGTFKSLSPFAVLETTKVESVQLTPSSLSLELGKSRQLQAAVSPTNAYNKKVTWKSSNKKVVTVSPSGLVKAAKAGTATITCAAADGGGAKATCKITVKNTSTPILIMKGTAGKNSIRLNWNQISNADGYEIYGSRCGGKYSYKKINTIKNNATKTWTQSKLRTTTAYKYYIKAYKLVNGRKLYLRTSKTCHVTTTGGLYTNVKSVTTTFTDITLSKGKTRQISARVTPVKKGVKLANHVPAYRYKTTNSKVASITASGKIKAVVKGKCSIYVYANNGVTRRIQVSVQ